MFVLSKGIDIAATNNIYNIRLVNKIELINLIYQMLIKT